MRSYRLDDPRLVTTGAALRAEGYSPGRIAAEIAAGRWRRHGHAIVLHNGPLSREQRWFVARSHAGPRALLTGLTAAEAFGLRGWERDAVHLLVPAGARKLGSCPPYVQLHRVRDWDRVRRHGRTAVHARPDALLVAAASFRAPRPACGVLAAAVQQRVVSTAALREALGRHGCLRHRRVLLAAIEDITQGSQALSEIDFIRLCRRAGLPRP